MVLSFFKKFRKRLSLPMLLTVVLCFLTSLTSSAHPPSPRVVEMFPVDLGGFHQLPSMQPNVSLARQGLLQPQYFVPPADSKDAPPFLGGETEYLSAEGDKFLVEIIRVQNDSNAYSLLTLVAKIVRYSGKTSDVRVGEIGTS